MDLRILCGAIGLERHAKLGNMLTDATWRDVAGAKDGGAHGGGHRCILSIPERSALIEDGGTSFKCGCSVKPVRQERVLLLVPGGRLTAKIARNRLTGKPQVNMRSAIVHTIDPARRYVRELAI